MIPLAIKLEGFLCYVEEQEATFGGTNSLWMLSGVNGSGKSAIFDAVTYALFGHHRGGGQQASELINKDSDRLVVEFDFLLDNKEYRIKRTLKRTARGTSGTQQILQRDPSGNGEAKFVPVENTQNKRDGFDPWVKENLGIDYDTFTSSVLLLQGKAEKLLDSKPEGRRSVLAKIVDLERYERLHRLANDQKKQLEGKLDGLVTRLEGMDRVDDEQLDEATQAISRAEEDRKGSRGELEKLQQLSFRASQWLELQQQRQEAVKRLEWAQGLLDQSSDIIEKYDRLKELRQVVPHVQALMEYRETINSAEKKSEQLAESKRLAVDAVAQKENGLRLERDKRATMQRLQNDEETRKGEVADSLGKLSVQLEKLEQYERQKHDLDKLEAELAKFPDDLAAQITRAKEELSSLEDLSRVIPQLARLVTRREELRVGLEEERTSADALKAITEKGKRLGAEIDKAKPEFERAGAELSSAQSDATQARTLLQQAEQSLREVSELGGSSVCRHCGQALTEGHLEAETERRQRERDEAKQNLARAEQRLSAAKDEEQNLREALEKKEADRVEARVEYKEAESNKKQAQSAVDRVREECSQIYQELPAEHRKKIGAKPPTDWLSVSYPTEEDVESARAESSSLEARRAELRELEARQQKWSRLEVQQSTLGSALKRLEEALPRNRLTLREEHAALEVEQKSLQKSIEARKNDLRALDLSIDKLNKDCEDCRASVSRIDAQANEQKLQRENAEKSLERTRKLLPESWLDQLDRVNLSSWNKWMIECQELESEGIEQRSQELDQARVRLDVLRKEKEDLDSKQEEFAEEARRDPKEIEPMLADARGRDQECENALASARQEKTNLENLRKQREQIEKQRLSVEGEARQFGLLSELLGRDRLQLYLVRQAERQVVDYANAVLDRLSGGQLYLKLTGEAEGAGSSAKALELEAFNRVTGEKPINVAFLSGSQKFRVAVSLALGIGQYASHQHRPIESVIIDEGFGCLDRQGRQVMIQELQNLRGQMRCILLVSHQEEFAEAFSDGYHFALEDGATRIKRMEK